MEETHGRFSHVFVHFGSTVLFNIYVVEPTNSVDADRHRHEFEESVFLVVLVAWTQPMLQCLGVHRGTQKRSPPCLFGATDDVQNFLIFWHAAAPPSGGSLRINSLFLRSDKQAACKPTTSIQQQ